MLIILTPKKNHIDVWTHIVLALEIIYIYFENNIIKLEDFNVLNVNSLNYEEHNYIRESSIKNEIQNLSKNQLKEKLKNYKYRLFYLKEIAI